MAFMRRDVNIGLLLLIVAALVMFSGFTVYYQTTFKNLSKTYDTQLKELESISNELESKRTALNETSIQLQLKKQKEEDLSAKFVDTKSEKDKLETDKKKLEIDLASTKAQLQSTSAQLSNTQNQLADKANQIASMTSQISTLNGKVNSLEDDIEDLEAENSCLDSKPDSEEGSC